MKRANTRINGFTLLEVLVALTIVAIALPALIKTVGTQAINAAHLKEKTLAHWVALNRVTELQATRAWPEVGIKDGTETMAGQDWHWVVAVSETPNETIKRLDIEVKKDREDKKPLVNLVAYLGKPP